jgi:hypothetical protein
MGLFEQQPLLMIPFILVVVAGYDAAKWAIRRWVIRAGEDGRRSAPRG